MLNALRHQRFGTAVKPGTLLGLRCAQRLTASEVWHLKFTATNARIVGAQRLTASEVWHGDRCEPTDYCYAVWCSTPYGIRGLARPGCATGYQTLNSAQRLTASEVWHLRFKNRKRFDFSSAQRLTASEVWHQSADRSFYNCRIVLNALRHQRFGTEN